MEEQRGAKTWGVMRKKSKFLRKRPDRTWDCRHWRWISVSHLRRACLAPSLLSHDIPASSAVLSIFDQIIIVDLFCDYMGYTSQFINTSQGASTQIDEMTTLAWLHLFISTVIYCFWDDSVEMVGGHCQKLNSDTFCSFLSAASASSLGLLHRFCFHDVQKSFMFRL